MRTYRFDPAIGQRYVHRQAGVADSIWVLTAIPRPQTIADPVLLTFTEELTQRVFRRSTAHLGQEILEGRLTSEHHRPPSLVDSGPLALTHLVASMSRSQLRHYKMQVSYVLALDRANIGQSHKSPDFGRLIAAAYSLRLAAWKLKAAETPGANIEPIEPKAPAPTSVYRWFLRYRKAGNDLRVLAHSALVTRTRSARKPKDKELLAAFLAGRLASLELVSIKTLTDEFNQLLAKSNPLHTDELIESLYAKAIATASANKRARSGNKTSMSSKRRKSASVKARTTQVNHPSQLHL